MDSQNRDYQERLSQKTAFLKSLAVDIESEAKDHHRLLDGVGDDFDGSSGMLTNSLGRVNKMLGGGKTNIYQASSVVFNAVVADYESDFGTSPQEVVELRDHFSLCGIEQFCSDVVRTCNHIFGHSRVVANGF